MSDTVFYNVWSTETADNQATLIKQMKDEAPTLAAKPGFISMTVSECVDDGRVIVEAHWRDQKAFDKAVATDQDAQDSRKKLEKLGAAKPGIFRKAFHVSSEPSDLAADPTIASVTISTIPRSVTFIQIWQMESAERQKRWLEVTKSHIGFLIAQPGFISMSLHTSQDSKQTVVYAQWTDEASFTSAVNTPRAKRGHDDMARWGTSDGTLYSVDAVYLPRLA